MVDHAQLTFVPGDVAPAGGWLALWSSDAESDLRVAAERLGLPTGDPVVLPSVHVDGADLATVDVPARRIPVLPAVRRLATMPPGSDWPAWRRPAPSVLTWSVAAKLALELVVAGRLVPGLTVGSQPGTAIAMWRVTAGSDPRVAEVAEAAPVAAHALRRPSGEVWSAYDLVASFLDAVADACAREGRRPDLDPRRRGPRGPWAEMWVSALTGSDPTVAHLKVAPEEAVAEVADWAAPLLGHDRRQAARLAVRLEAPSVDDEPGVPAQAVGRPWRLSYHLQASRDPSARIGAADVWEHGDRPLELASRRVEDPESILVRGLSVAARLFSPIDRSLSQTRPTGVDLSAGEAAELLADGADALMTGGIGVEVPPELRGDPERRLRLRVRIGQSAAPPPRTDGDEALGLGSIADLRYEIAVGDEVLTPDEFAAIAAIGEPLVRWRGRWVRVDRGELERIGELAGRSASLELTEALAAALSGQHHVRDLGWVETVGDGRLGELLERLRSSPGPSDADIVDFEGVLRPYQERGVAWLQRLTALGMGGVLADEMGLGKTVMAIALLTSRAQDRPHLVVCPTSVVGNWERELRRFAPDVAVRAHHGPDRAVTGRSFRPGEVVVTSYALLRRDLGLLEGVDWDVVVLDEAQQIKNPSSKGARAARALPARARVAMTGTPVENRLSELWAIVDVTNPGLLGSQRSFNSRFAVPIERWHDDGAAQRLRRLVSPFVLRRRKDDAEVSVDLPPKQEVMVACSLTREQASLYQAAVARAFEGEGLGSTTFERRGRILALLTALKQICNHPAHFLRDVDLSSGRLNGRLEGRSGKLSRATEILGELVDAGDRALVFTQFREMGQLLAAHLAEQLELPDVPFLHGGVPMVGRDAMVTRFQEDADASPILLVSLRAGGTGLNLTRASHVLHYDRWWNPAVEDQATDRAHRIGQSRAVTVHTLVAAGTIEDRIADLLVRKRALADAVVGTGETWITELDDAELRELVELSSDGLADEDDEPSPRPVLTPLPGGRS